MFRCIVHVVFMYNQIGVLLSPVQGPKHVVSLNKDKRHKTVVF